MIAMMPRSVKIPLVVLLWVLVLLSAAATARLTFGTLDAAFRWRLMVEDVQMGFRYPVEGAG